MPVRARKSRDDSRIIMRRTHSVLAAAIALALLAMPNICSAKPRALVGAIRWDAWVGDTPTPGHSIPVGLQMEAALGPHQFHDRIAFYGKETGPDSIEMRELTQDVMDKDIGYAHDGGIDYWAFDYYSDDSGLATARHLYLSSKIKKLIGLSLNLHRLVWQVE